MSEKELLIKIKKELKKYIENDYKKGESRFFKHKIKNMGVRVPNRRKVGRKLYKEVKDWPKNRLFNFCEQLMKTEYSEMFTIAFAWIDKRKVQFEKKDFKTFENWLKKYIDNWAKCDDFCTHALAKLVYKYPELLINVFSWTKSKKRFVRRASAVILIRPFSKERKYLTNILKTAKKLLTDCDDIVQKGYGWMLKEASNNFEKEVFDFVIKYKKKMPRTALRYAIEKMNKNKKQIAMEK